MELEIVGGIVFIFRIPVAENIIGGQGYFSGYQSEVFQGAFVVMAITEEVEVEGVVVGTCCHPVDSVGFCCQGQ